MSFGFGMKFQNLLLAKAGYSNIVSADGTLAPFVTFTRTTTGSRYNSAGLLETMAINAPRFDYDPATVTRANLLRYSEQFNNATWGKGRASVIANVTQSPNGDLSADKIVENTDTNSHFVTQSIAVTASTIYTFSVFLKAAERRFAQVRHENEGSTQFYAANVNLSDGTFTAASFGSPTGTSAAVSNAGNGWWRVQISISASNASFACIIYPQEVQGTNSYTGNGTSGIFVWGAQLEAGSSSTEYIQTVASPAGNATLLGLLVEEQRTNFYNISNSFTPGTGTTITAASAVGIDGTLNASRYAKTDATTPRYSNSPTTMSVAVNTAYTASRHFKYDGFDTTVSLEYNNTDNWGGVTWVAIFNVTSSGVSVASANACTATVKHIGNGWYRATATFTTGATIALPTNPQTLVRITGASGVSVLMTSAQLEAGAFATSYIPTVATTQTRTVDNASVTNISNIGFNSSEGTLFAEANPSLVPAGDGVVRFVVALFDNTAYANAVRLERLVGGFRDVQTVGGASNVTGVPWTTGVNGKMAGAYANSNSAASFNGSSPGSLAGAVPPGMVTLGIGGNGAGSNIWNGHVRRVAYYPRRLSNAELQQITT